MLSIPISAAVEGIVDEAALRRIARLSGVDLGTIYVTRGKDQLDRRLDGFNAAARRFPWLVLRDLDNDAGCAPTLVRHLLAVPSEHMDLRIPVRSLEAWLLADRKNLASFLRLSSDLIASEPEKVERPKLEMVSLARRSRSGPIRRDMVPEEGISARVGPGYTARLIEFINDHWQPHEAAQRSDSLARCLRTMERFAAPGL